MSASARPAQPIAMPPTTQAFTPMAPNPMRPTTTAAAMFNRNGFDRWPLMYLRLRRLVAASALKEFQRASDSVWWARE